MGQEHPSTSHPQSPPPTYFQLMAQKLEKKKLERAKKDLKFLTKNIKAITLELESVQKATKTNKVIALEQGKVIAGQIDTVNTLKRKLSEATGEEFQFDEPNRPVEEEDLEEELLCIICTGLFIDPVLLPCGHAFCRKCISKALKVRYKCPMCRQAGSYKLKRVPVVEALVHSQVSRLSLEARLQRLEVERERQPKAKMQRLQ